MNDISPFTRDLVTCLIRDKAHISQKAKRPQSCLFDKKTLFRNFTSLPGLHIPSLKRPMQRDVGDLHSILKPKPQPKLLATTC